MLLAVDCSTQWMGLALFQEEQILIEQVWQTKSHHSVELAPAIDQIFKKTGTSTKDLTVLAVATGPGSFTSLRIGMAAVKGMALALNLPVIGIPTLDILASGVQVRDMALAAVLQAGRGRLAVGWYEPVKNHWISSDEMEVLTPDELEQKIRKTTMICGELTVEERQTLARRWKKVVLASPAECVRRPAYLAQLAWERWQNMDVDEVVSLSPSYLHYKEAVPG